MRKVASIALAATLVGGIGLATVSNAEARHRRNHVGAAIAGAIVGGVLLNQFRGGYGYPGYGYSAYPYGYGGGYGYAYPSYRYGYGHNDYPRYRAAPRRSWGDRGWRGRNYGGYRDYGNPYRGRRSFPEGSAVR